MSTAAPQPIRRAPFDPRSVRAIGVIAALHKRRIGAVVTEAVEWLRKRDLRALLPSDQADALSLHDIGADRDRLAAEADLLLSLGGDGTLLAAARIGAPRGKPILGVNLGGFGFLAAVPASEMTEALAGVMKGRASIQDRMMLAARVLRGEEEVASFAALNDIVVGKGAFSRLLRFKTSISGVPVSYFPADGMVVSTPTGSTGYALSAGGPVIDPEAQVITIAPICPHALSARTLVVPAGRVIEIALPHTRGEEVNLTADGQEGFSLQAGDRVEVREAPFSARLVCLDHTGFYTKLRTKLGWGSKR
jgi:NAD+ kinase